MRLCPLRYALALLAALLVGMPSASAGVEHWQLSEVFQDSSQGNANRRFVELSNTEGGCLFPTSTLDFYDAEGQLLSIQSLAQGTSCFGAPTYFLLATPEITSEFGVPRDRALLASLPAAGQICFSSSQTNYDCVRWGTISNVIVDLFGQGDQTTISVGSNLSISRIATTHLVDTDWQARSPSPRQPNDGSVWIPPDAGPQPDAGAIVDAGEVSDARMRIDSGAGADAQGIVDTNDRYLDLDPTGGASCSCQSGPGGGSAVWIFALLLLWWRSGKRIKG
ncbi:MAG: hypothetical protein JKY56_15570 [Kofleriaceae bacterium]|nr:hypothetical protein [Kofleriaceae bacterium]